jgi:hypothetical protein
VRPRALLLAEWPSALLPAPRKLKFTREGKYYLGITLGVGFAAINTGNNLLYLLLGMLLSLIVVSGVMSDLSLKQPDRHAQVAFARAGGPRAPRRDRGLQPQEEASRPTPSRWKICGPGSPPTSAAFS